MGVLENISASLGETEARMSRKYFVPGQFWLKINQVKTGRAGVTELNPDGDYDFFAAEFEVVHSTTPERPSGSFVNWMISMKHSKLERMYARDIKNFLVTAYTSKMGGQTPPTEEINGDVMKATIGEEQPLAGHLIKGVASTVPTKAGGEFTNLSWVYWDGSMPSFTTATVPPPAMDDGLAAVPF